MLNTGSKIESGNESINNQAQSITNNYGLSYADVREIATDVFKSSITQLSETASAIAWERASEMTEKFLLKLEKEAPQAINEFATPAMQDTYFQAQKEYALNGDEDVADMLVEMLVERAKSPTRNRTRMVLDESLKVAPKLTIQQMDLLTLSYCIFRSKIANVKNFEDFAVTLNKDLSLLDNIDSAQVNDDIYFLEYLRLGKRVEGTFSNPNESFIQHYPAYLCKGFTLDECHVPEIPSSELFIPCFHDVSKFQFRFESVEGLIELLRDKNLTEERISYITSFFTSHVYLSHELTNVFSSKIPNFEILMSLYNTTQWKSFEMSPVGTAIAISNYHRRFGVKHNLATWVK